MTEQRLSKRAKLRRLVALHPEWTYRRFALELGQTPDVIRGAFGAMKLPRPPRDLRPLDRPLIKWDGTTVRRKDQWKQLENT